MTLTVSMAPSAEGQGYPPVGDLSMFDEPEGEIVVLGGCESCGLFVNRAFPDHLSQALGGAVVNLSRRGAGLDAHLGDGALLARARAARGVVLTVPGAHALRNGFFDVHPRRNDRVVSQSDGLRTLFPEVDFSRHHFVRHMLGDLARRSPTRFAVVRDGLQRQWVMRMRELCEALEVPVTLLWMGRRTPDEGGACVADGDPPLVTRAMLERLSDVTEGLVEVVERPRDALAGKSYLAGQEAAAAALPGPEAHARAAARLASRLVRLPLGACARQVA